MSQLNSLNTSVLFTNWTNEDFTWKWDGQPFTFKARSTETINAGTREHNEGLAQHFAKHLTDRELNKRGIPTDHFTREEFLRNCFLDKSETKDVPVLEVELHPETGLVKTITEVGREDVVKKTKTASKPRKHAVVVPDEPQVEETVEEAPKQEEDAEQPTQDNENVAEDAEKFEE